MVCSMRTDDDWSSNSSLMKVIPRGLDSRNSSIEFFLDLARWYYRHKLKKTKREREPAWQEPEFRFSRKVVELWPFVGGGCRWGLRLHTPYDVLRTNTEFALIFC